MTRLKAAASDQPPQLQPELLNGTFSGLLNTTNYLAADSSSTLGTLTFQQFAPKDLKVRPHGFASDVRALHSAMDPCCARTAKNEFCVSFSRKIIYYECICYLQVMVSGTEMLSGVESPEHYQTNTYFEVSSHDVALFNSQTR